MSVPQFLASSYRYLKRTGVVDVQTIINDVYAELIALGWTCTAGGSGLTPTTMLSPVRSDELRFSVKMTRYSATQLDWTMYDAAGVQVSSPYSASYRQTITSGGAGTNVHYITGLTFCYVYNVGGTSWMIRNCVLDNAPYSSLCMPRPAYYAHYSDSLWGPTGYAWAPLTGGYAENAWGVRRWSNENSDQAGISISGAYLSSPHDIVYYSVPCFLLGRLPQVIMVDHALVAETEYTFPIDTGVTGTFVAAGGDAYGHLAFRRA